MAFTGNIIARIGADIRGLQKGLNQAQRDINSFKNSASNQLSGLKVTIAAASAAIGGALAMLGKESTKSAMSFEANLQQINRLLGENSKQFLQWAGTQANLFGLSKVEAVKYASQFATLLRISAKDQKSLMENTQKLLQMSAVVSSSTGRDITDVMERVRSGLVGNTEAIEDLGINVFVNLIEMTDAFKRFSNGVPWQELDFKTQQQIRLFAILEQATGTFGNELRDNTATAFQILLSTLKDVALNIGLGLKPVLDATLPSLIAFANAAKNLAGGFAQAMNVLFGSNKEQKKTADTAINAAKGQAKFGNELKKAGDKAKGALMGFDEINQLQEDISNNSETTNATDMAGFAGAPLGGGMESPIPTGFLSPDMIQSIEKFRERILSVKQTFSELWDEMKQTVTNNKDIIIAGFAGISAALIAVGIAISTAKIISAFQSLYIVALYTLEAIGVAFAAINWPITLTIAAIGLLTAAFVYLYRANEPFRAFVSDIWQGIQNFFVSFWKNILVPFGQFLGGVFVGAWNLLSNAASWFYDNVLVPIGRFLLVFWKNIIEPLAKALGEALAIAFDGVATVATSFWKNVMVPLGQFLMELFNPAVEAMSAIFMFLWNNVIVPIGNDISATFTPVFKALGETITWLWQNVLKPLITFLKDIFVTAFSSVFESVHKIIDDLKETFKSLLNFITNVFTGEWGKAWENIKDVFKGIVNTLEDIFKVPIRGIINILNLFIDKLNSLKIKIPEVSIPGIGTFGGNTVGFNINKIPQLAQGGIVDSPTLAMIGEAGTEAVVPLENTGFIDAMASKIGSAVIAAMQFNSGNQTQSGDIILQVDGSKFAQVMNPYLAKENQRIGNKLIIQGV